MFISILKIFFYNKQPISMEINKNDVFYEFGEYGPLFLYFLSNFILWKWKHFKLYYNIGSLCNVILNTILKGIIQEPRPLFNEKDIYLAKTNGKRFFFQNGIPFHLFGMPSGHAQVSFFTTTFIYFVLNHKNWALFYLVCSGLICYQRVYYQYHSVLQVCIGACVGGFLGYQTYLFATKSKQGKLKPKPDDFAMMS